MIVCATGEFDFLKIGIYRFNYYRGNKLLKKEFLLVIWKTQIIKNIFSGGVFALPGSPPPPADVPVSSSPDRYARDCKIHFMFHFSVISTTYETDDGSKATNTVPHSSPLDVLQTTTMAPNETAEPFCLVMGKLLVTIVIARFCSFSLPLLPSR